MNNLDDLFERLSDCLEEAFGFNQALLSWISSSESDHRIDTLQNFKNSDSAQPLIGGTNNPAPCFRIVTPLSDRGQVIGSLELLKKTPPFSVKELDLLRQVGNHIAPAVYNTGLHHLTIRQASQLQQRTTGVASPQQSSAGYVTQDEEPMIDLAHALYSPLTSIKGYTGSLLQPDTNWPEEVRQEFLRTINQAADRLNQAIKDLVLPTPQNISSQVAGQPETPLQDISHQLELGLLDPPKGVNVNFVCNPAFPPVFINPWGAERAVKYMVDCASAYTASPGELQVLETADHESATISVEFMKWPGQPSLASDNSEVDSDLRVVVCRKILYSIGTTLNVGTREANAVRLWFQTPVVQ